MAQYFWGLLLYAVLLGAGFTSRMPKRWIQFSPSDLTRQHVGQSQTMRPQSFSTFGLRPRGRSDAGRADGYIGSSEQIFQRDVYQLGEHFPLMFGAIAMSMERRRSPPRAWSRALACDAWRTARCGCFNAHQRFDGVCVGFQRSSADCSVFTLIGGVFVLL